MAENASCLSVFLMSGRLFHAQDPDQMPPRLALLYRRRRAPRRPKNPALELPRQPPNSALKPEDTQKQNKTT